MSRTKPWIVGRLATHSHSQFVIDFQMWVKTMPSWPEINFKWKVSNFDNGRESFWVEPLTYTNRKLGVVLSNGLPISRFKYLMTFRNKLISDISLVFPQICIIEWERKILFSKEQVSFFPAKHSTFFKKNCFFLLTAKPFLVCLNSTSRSRCSDVTTLVIFSQKFFSA